jgi:uncharacterized membrane protein (UPF0127 family)
MPSRDGDAVKIAERQRHVRVAATRANRRAGFSIERQIRHRAARG